MRFDVHPAHLVDQASLDLVALYFRCRSGGMDAGRLPFAGSVMEQPAKTLAALEFCGVLEAGERRLARDAEAARHKRG